MTAPRLAPDNTCSMNHSGLFPAGHPGGFGHFAGSSPPGTGRPDGNGDGNTARRCLP